MKQYLLLLVWLYFQLLCQTSFLLQLVLRYDWVASHYALLSFSRFKCTRSKHSQRTLLKFSIFTIDLYKTVAITLLGPFKPRFRPFPFIEVNVILRDGKSNVTPTGVVCCLDSLAVPTSVVLFVQMSRAIDVRHCWPCSSDLRRTVLYNYSNRAIESKQHHEPRSVSAFSSQFYR